MAVHSIILDWLEKELAAGRLRLGQDLPDDRKIAKAAGMTHSAAREALKHLEDMGIVSLYEGRKKTIIAQLVEDPVASAAPALRLHTAQAEYPTRDLVQTRMLLEGWAAENADPQHPALEETHEILDRMQEPNISVGEFYALEVSFHMALVRSSGNELLSGLMGAMRPALFDYLMSIAGASGLWSTAAARLRSQHRATIAAIEAGDNVMAASLLRSQIRAEYEEAGIDLDAPRIPEPLDEYVESLEPVDIDEDDLLPESPDFSVSASLIDALNSIEPVKPAEPVADSESEAEPQLEKTETETEVVGGAENDYQPVQPNLSPEETDSRKEEIAAPTPERVLPEPFRTQEPQEPQPNSVVRAGTTGRRHSGTVSTPVHATVIKPLNRSGATGVIAGQVASASEQTNKAAKDTESINVLRAKPRPATAVPSSEQMIARQKQEDSDSTERGFFHWRRKNKAVDDKASPDTAVENAPKDHPDKYSVSIESRPTRSKTQPKNAQEANALPSQPAPVDPLQETEALDSAKNKRNGRIKQFFGWGVENTESATEAENGQEHQHQETDSPITEDVLPAGYEHVEPKQSSVDVQVVEEPQTDSQETADSEATESDSVARTATHNPLAGKNQAAGKGKSKKKKKRKR